MYGAIFPGWDLHYIWKMKMMAARKKAGAKK